MKIKYVECLMIGINFENMKITTENIENQDATFVETIYKTFSYVQK